MIQLFLITRIGLASYSAYLITFLPSLSAQLYMLDHTCDVRPIVRLTV